MAGLFSTFQQVVSEVQLTMLFHAQKAASLRSGITEVCKDVCIEPVLLPLTGQVLECRAAIRDDGARLDNAAN